MKVTCKLGGERQSRLAARTLGVCGGMLSRFLEALRTRAAAQDQLRAGASTKMEKLYSNAAVAVTKESYPCIATCRSVSDCLPLLRSRTHRLPDRALKAGPMRHLEPGSATTTSTSPCMARTKHPIELCTSIQARTLISCSLDSPCQQREPQATPRHAC